MFRLLGTLLLTNFFNYNNAFRIVGWFNGNQQQIQQIPFDKYTHIVTGYPILHDNGTLECNKGDNITKTILILARENNVTVQWRCPLPKENIIMDWANYPSIRNNYITSLPNAMKECNIDGVEFDYEWADRPLGKIGIVTPYMAERFSDFLQDVKNAVGPTKLVSADIGTWGCCCEGCGYPLGVLPWINVTRLNEGEFDFVNVMSYHNQYFENIDYWEKDYHFLKDIWGYNLSRVNLGIAYFTMNSSFFKIHSEPLWSNLSPHCPNIDPKINICEDIPFTGKELNYRIGAFAKEKGFGGLFPWTINYDSFEYNNTLINWAYAGVNSI